MFEYRTVGEAAESIVIGQSTLFRWMEDHNFQRPYLRTKRKVIDQAVTKLQNMCGDAVEVLRQIMIDEVNTPTSRIAFARAILILKFKGFQLEELSTRIDALEKALQNR